MKFCCLEDDPQWCYFSRLPSAHDVYSEYKYVLWSVPSCSDDTSSQTVCSTPWIIGMKVSKSNTVTWLLWLRSPSKRNIGKGIEAVHIRSYIVQLNGYSSTQKKKKSELIYNFISIVFHIVDGIGSQQFLSADPEAVQFTKIGRQRTCWFFAIQRCRAIGDLQYHLDVERSDVVRQGLVTSHSAYNEDELALIGIFETLRSQMILRQFKSCTTIKYGNWDEF